MKTIRITLTKPGAQATCTLVYRITEGPDEETWAGNRAAFSLFGMLPAFGFPVDQLAQVVPYQAAQSGAEFTIEDLGGDAIFAHDIVRCPSDPSDL